MLTFEVNASQWKRSSLSVKFQWQSWTESCLRALCGRLLALSANIRAHWKGVERTNGLAYLVSKKKMFNSIDSKETKRICWSKMHFSKKKKKSFVGHGRGLELGPVILAIVILTLVMLSDMAPFYVSFEHCSMV
jgi:hypothetical protein